jgi:hypothetical protein
LLTNIPSYPAVGRLPRQEITAISEISVHQIFRKYFSFSIRVLANYGNVRNLLFWKSEHTSHSGDAWISSYIIAFSFLSFIFDMQGSSSQGVVVNFQ